VLGVGVALALLTAMTLTPIIFSLMKAPPPIRVGASSKFQIFLYRAVDFVVKLTRAKPWVIVMSFIVLLVITITGVVRVEFETDINKRLDEDNPLNVDNRYFSRHFAGTNYLDVFIEAPEPGGIINADFMSRIALFQKELIGIQEVDKVTSIFDVINRIHAKLQPELSAQEIALPDEDEIGNYLAMLKMSGKEFLKTMIDADNQTVKIRLNLIDGGFFTSHRVTQSVSAAAQSIFNDRVRVEVMGLTSLLGEWVEGYIKGQKKGLIFAFMMIFFMMTVALRSFSGGTWSMLPNVIPLLFLGGYVGWFWETADSDILMVAIIAIGIAVDNTIHFLFRFRHELKQTENIEIALDKTFHFSGRAIFITTVILVAGFSPFALSGYSSAKIMGTLLPAILAATLFTDMLLIPALIKLGAFQFVKRDEGVRQIKLSKILKHNDRQSKTLQERAARS
jgi:predicted RND superfamily exporter protein